MWRRLYRTEIEIWEGRIMGMSQKDIPRHDHHPPDDIFAIKCSSSSSSSSVIVINFTSNKMKLFRTDLTLRRDRSGMPEGHRTNEIGPDVTSTGAILRSYSFLLIVLPHDRQWNKLKLSLSPFRLSNFNPLSLSQTPSPPLHSSSAQNLP